MRLLISQQEATRKMKLVCGEQGYAAWESARKYPKMQIRTVKDLLENPKRPFEIPDSARLTRSQGVGMAQPGQEGLGI